jgi:hypothetical protein
MCTIGPDELRIIDAGKLLKIPLSVTLSHWLLGVTDSWGGHRQSTILIAAGEIISRPVYTSGFIESILIYKTLLKFQN